MDRSTRELIERLGLAPHPEGGHYREVFRSETVLELERGPRTALTAIHFVLGPGEVSSFHRVRSDELWCFQDGSEVELELLTPASEPRTLRLGREGAAEPLAAVPAGTWQAAVSLGPGPSWCSCFVAPGFEFADFELASFEALAAAFPDRLDLIRRFTPDTTS